MKQLYKGSISLLIGILFLGGYCYASESNLLENGDFEENNAPWIYHTWDTSEEVTQFGIDTQVKHSGGKSVWVKNNLSNDARYKQKISVEENTYYLLSCYIKTEDVAEDSKGANISTDEITDTSIDIVGTTDGWEYVELYGVTGPTQKDMVISVGLGGFNYTNTGKAWFDDVAVVKVDELPAGITPVNLFRNPEVAKNQNNKALFSYLLIAIGGLLSLIKFRSKKGRLKAKSIYTTIYESSNVNAVAYEKLVLTKTDFILMFSMTLVYLIMAVMNLGSTKVPETEWTPHYNGESFHVQFDDITTISRISFFKGLGDDREAKGVYQVEYLNADNQFIEIEPITKEKVFVWDYVDTEDIMVKELKITVVDSGGSINEMGFFNQETLISNFKVINKSNEIGTVENLFDEQETVAYLPSYYNGTYFDEVYFARTAYEHVHALKPYENTHPPLGKLFIAIGISIFGMNPFGWRIIGTLFGVAMIPVMYLFGKKLFGKTFYAFCAAFLMMFDFMHFTQTRIATIDGYGTLFIILMYYFMYDYFMKKSYAMDLKKTLWPLFISGLCFGLGVASKWISLYGGLGLAILFFWSRYSEFKDYVKELRSHKYKKEAWVQDFMSTNKITLVACVVFFVIIPLTIYCLSYIPLLSLPRNTEWIREIINYQKHMLDYHSNLIATHPFSSEWWEWPIIKRPTWYYNGDGLLDTRKSTIAALGNPAIWWTGILAVWASIEIAISKKDKKMAVIFIAMAGQYLPWMLVPRITWIYHFFSTTPFMMLSIVYVMKNLIEAVPKSRNWIYGYLGLVMILFIVFYPVLSGMEVNVEYIEGLKWFKSWVF